MGRSERAKSVVSKYKETELYREPADSDGKSYYSPYVVLIEGEQPCIRMCAGGKCSSMTVEDWVELAWQDNHRIFSYKSEDKTNERKQ